MTPSGRPRFALDQNFPTPIIQALEAYIAEAELAPLATVHPRLPTLDDDPWELLRRVATQRGSGDPRSLYDRHKLGSLKQVARGLLKGQGGRGRPQTNRRTRRSRKP